MDNLEWAESELAEIVRIVSPAINEDAVTNAILITAIRRLIEADYRRYLDLMKRYGGK